MIQVFKTYISTVLLALALLSGPLFAQDGPGLPGGPVLGDGFRAIEKYATSCTKCKGEERVFHAAVDRYNAAVLEYERLAQTVRDAAREFVETRDEIDRLSGEMDRLDALETAMKADDAYTRDDYVHPDDIRRENSEVTDAFYDTREKILPGKRAALRAALDALEAQRQVAVANMRAALRLEAAMFRCETQCELDELDPDVRVSLPPTPETPELLDPGQIPTPETVTPVTAACPECQPLADKVNQIRNHRRDFAVRAQTLHAAMVENQRRLAQLTRDASALDAEERALYQQLGRTFAGANPGGQGDAVDWGFDNRSQAEATAALRDIAARRAKVQQDMAGVARTIQDQFRGILEAIANYHAHGALLQAAVNALAECEAGCPPPSPDPADDPFTDPNYPIPENIDPLVAKCWECQPFVDAMLQTMVKRRSVAGDIQSTVWMLKGRRASVDRARTRLDALDAEKRQMGELLRIGRDGGANEDYALDRLFEIEREETELVQNMLADEEDITRFEADLERLLAEYEALTRQIEMERAAWEICEFNKCQSADGEPIIGIPEFQNPGIPVPEPFTYVATDCPDCQSLADLINKLMLERYVLAGRMQSTATALTAHKAALEAKKAELPALAERIGELGPPYVLAETPAAKAAAAVPLDAAIEAERRAKAEVEALETLIQETEAALQKLQAEHDAKTFFINILTRQLAECEARCTAIAEPDPQIYIAGQDPFVTTDCPPCEVKASMVNDAVGTQIFWERELAKAKADFDRLVAEAQERQARLDEVLAREQELLPAWTEAYVNRTDDFPAISDQMNEVDRERQQLEEEQAGEAAAQEAAQQAINDAQAKVDEYKLLVAKLKGELAECEEQCKPGDETGLVVPETSFVTTDCEPCFVLASQINDVVGSLITQRRILADKQATLAALQAKTADLEAAQEAARAEYRRVQEDFLSPENRGRQDELFDGLGEADDAQLDAELALVDNADAITEALGDIAALEAEIARLVALEADLRAQLAECEQQCQPPAEGTDTALPESPFVTTDCERCVTLASLINDVVGTRIGAERRLEEARGKRAALDTDATAREARIDALRDEIREINRQQRETSDLDAYKVLFDREETLSSELIELEWAQEDAEQDAAKLDREIADLEAEIARLTQQEADLKAQLAECERTCNDPDETAMGDPEPSPFVTTDCEPLAGE